MKYFLFSNRTLVNLMFPKEFLSSYFEKINFNFWNVNKVNKVIINLILLSDTL